ncbi:MAG TPA: cysteine hydrolase family protein [Egibacteraceae bacterium]|nr:cysteine hydrolase family protein [Egibacteraceae bacterium]
MSSPALIVIDVQRGFDDPSWGRRDNPDCEPNIARLLRHWRVQGWPVVFVRHDSPQTGSPLAPGSPGNTFKDVVDGQPDLFVVKRVNSAFYGEPDLHQWLQAADLDQLIVCGITTNHCCETTARMAGNLGYRVRFALDATHTFDRRAPDGQIIPAEQIARVTAANLDGEFAEVTTTARLVRDSD